MKRNIKSSIGFTMGATDGDIGAVKDFYFEDDSWIVRYLVIETGSWLNGRKVLISADALLIPDWKNKTFPIRLTKDQIKNSPDIDTELPVYRQQEIKLYEHYALGNYWRAGFVAGGMPLPMNDAMTKEDDAISDKKPDGDLHLRSTNKVTGYIVAAVDGTIGDVEDFIIDDETWKLDIIVVNTGIGVLGKKVLVPVKCITEIKWNISTVIIDISTQSVMNSAKYVESELWMI